MTEDVQVRNLSSRTRKTYINQISLFARHFGCSLALLDPKQIRDYQIFLAAKKQIATGSVAIAVAALRFLYRVTLKRDWAIEEILLPPKQPKKLPVVPSPEEVVELLAWVRPLANQAILTACYAAGPRISDAVSAGARSTSTAGAWRVASRRLHRPPTPPRSGSMAHPKYHLPNTLLGI